MRKCEIYLNLDYKNHWITFSWPSKVFLTTKLGIFLVYANFIALKQKIMYHLKYWCFSIYNLKIQHIIWIFNSTTYIQIKYTNVQKQIKWKSSMITLNVFFSKWCFFELLGIMGSRYLNYWFQIWREATWSIDSSGEPLNLSL